MNSSPTVDSTLCLSQDILLHVCSKCDDELLLRLYLLLPEQVRPILKLQQFWYLRCCYFSPVSLCQRVTADWKQIYHNISARIEHTLFQMNSMVTTPSYGTLALVRSESDPYVAGLSHLDTMLVLIEIYGPPKWNSQRQCFIWMLLQDELVYQHLVSNNMLAVSRDNVLSCLGSTCANRSVELVLQLLSVISELDPTALQVGGPDWISQAIRADRLDIYLALRGQLQDTDVDEHFCDYRPNDNEIASYLLREGMVSRASILSILEESCEEDDPSWLALLMECQFKLTGDELSKLQQVVENHSATRCKKYLGIIRQ